MNKKVYGHIEEWRNRQLKSTYPYVYFNGIYLKRCWGGSYDNVAILVALAVDEAFGCDVDEFRKILWMPETLIIYRYKYDKIKREQFNKLKVS
jgi:hypothetical protein